tara:strand:+ start:1525 stop:1851 length:327 start_codon:yes stop_codon:yes gene_type:complete
MAASKIIKPPLYLFILHVILFVVSILFFINFMSLNSYMYLSITAHLVGFVCLLIFLTVDKSISKSRNYSSDFTVSTSKILLYIYILFGAYLSWEIGYDLAYEEFLTSF